MPETRVVQPARGAEDARWSLVTARDLMKRDLVTIDRHASLSEAARILNGHGISGAPVTDTNGAIVGVVSLRDLVARLVENPDVRPPRASSPAGVRNDRTAEEQEIEEDLEEEYAGPGAAEADEDLVEDVMTAEIRSVRGDATLPEVAAAMKQHNVHRVLVEEGGRYVGLIGTLEVLDLFFP